jgi:hypothetical protein
VLLPDDVNSKNLIVPVLLLRYANLWVLLSTSQPSTLLPWLSTILIVLFPEVSLPTVVVALPLKGIANVTGRLEQLVGTASCTCKRIKHSQGN